MPTAIVPKSQMRKNENIVRGYGEVPLIDLPEEANVWWGLPGGRTTIIEKEAIAMAFAIDFEIRRYMRNPEQLIHVDS